MSDLKQVNIGLAELQSKMLITDSDRSKVISAINAIKESQAEITHLRKQVKQLESERAKRDLEQQAKGIESLYKDKQMSLVLQDSNAKLFYVPVNIAFDRIYHLRQQAKELRE